MTFDGAQWIWPWGKDRSALQQAVNEADWLQKWIESRTGLKPRVRPIATLPGWWVIEAPNSIVRAARDAPPEILTH